MRTILLLLFFVMSTGAHAAAPWMENLEACKTFQSDEAQGICRRIIVSRELLAPVPIAFTSGMFSNLVGIATMREFAIAAWDKEDRPHIIKLTMPVRVKQKDVFQPKVLTPGYEVERLAGIGPYKLVFRVNDEEKELKVYGGKFLWLPHAHRGDWLTKTLMKVSREMQYLPSYPHLRHPEIARMGKNYLESEIDAVREELPNVPSQAFPGKILRDVWSTQSLLAVVASEQADADPFILGLYTTREEREWSFRDVFSQFAFHGPAAYQELCNSSGACAVWQFTNNPYTTRTGALYPGTYTVVHNTCKTFDGKPVLIKDFREGARILRNGAKAALCLLDMELAALPRETREEFLRDERMGSVGPLAAYNAGGRCAGEFIGKLNQQRKQPNAGGITSDPESFPPALFICKTKDGNKYIQETHWYVKKYLWAWDMLERKE